MNHPCFDVLIIGAALSGIGAAWYSSSSVSEPEQGEANA
jgi:cation diffusion facilitator CzcD-associated flavoprotein CzcO